MSFDILQHLETLTPDGGSSKPYEGSYLCPVCESSNFKVDLKTGKYGTYGCDCAQTPAGKRKIRDAIAPFTWEKPPRPSGKKTFTYDGLSNGVADTLAQVVREDDGAGKRSFYQQHWNGQHWVKGLPDQVKARLHLYRIFSPINEQAQGQRILLVEGEGKVDSLLALGIPATCSIGGAGKWHQYGHPNYLEDLAGYQVVLCPDRDEIGVKHCETVAADLEAHDITVAGWLYAFPQSPLWERLPKNKGADIADWIAEGATADEIAAVVEPRRQPPQPEQRESTQVEQGGKQPTGDADNLPKLAKRFRAVERIWARSLRFNQLTNNIELHGNRRGRGDLRLTLALDYGLSVSVADCEAIVKRLANNNTYHPVAEYLDSCAQTHGNGSAILDNLATELFGSQVPIHNVFLKKTLVAAVARIFQPGCKVDTALFLQGRQGFNKSSFFKTLVGATWFDDTMGSATSERDERLKLHQFWVLEWAELENVFKKRDISAVKAFLSCGVDTVRPP
ncbi:MAG: hypothetical protein HC812_19695, partial [Leptolyngbya sp. RL_3_1]|nr:hypothetical protein [Leptolyngbya sp. RL_3_1]